MVLVPARAYRQVRETAQHRLALRYITMCREIVHLTGESDWRSLLSRHSPRGKQRKTRINRLWSKEVWFVSPLVFPASQLSRCKRSWMAGWFVRQIADTVGPSERHVGMLVPI